MSVFTAFESHPSSSSSLDLVEQVRKLQEGIRRTSKLEIGDVVRIRGCIRIYRQQREIKAFTYCEQLLTRSMFVFYPELLSCYGCNLSNL